MISFVDTEFYEDGKTIELISIGVVREDGAEYYAETWAAKALCQRSDWLVQNVLPHLTGNCKSREEIAYELREFVGPSPELWAYAFA